ATVPDLDPAVFAPRTDVVDLELDLAVVLIGILLGEVRRNRPVVRADQLELGLDPFVPVIAAGIELELDFEGVALRLEGMSEAEDPFQRPAARFGAGPTIVAPRRLLEVVHVRRERRSLGVRAEPHEAALRSHRAPLAELQLGRHATGAEEMAPIPPRVL